MENKPIWLDKIEFNKTKALDKDISVDVLIIGAGITGLSAAYHLRNSNLNICVVDQNLAAHGVSARTTGKLTFLQENIYSKLKDNAKKYYESQRDAIDMVEKIVKDEKIDCNFKKVDSYVYTNKDSDINKINQEEQMLDKIGVKYEAIDNLPNNLECKYGIKVSNTAVFHPVKYLNALKEIIIKNKINIYENSSVLSINKKDDTYVCKVNNNTVTAKKVIVASHYPFFLFPLFMPIRVSMERSYLSASVIDKTKPFSSITVVKPTKSARYHEDNEKYFIYVTDSHNLCGNTNYKEKFINLISDLYNMNLEPKYIWSNQDIITEDSLPYIGYIEDSLLIATGYNTWGMTNGSIAGKILSDLVLKKDNKYKDLFDPKRNRKLTSLIKYPLHISTNAKSFIENKVIKNKVWYPNSVFFTKIKNKNVAIYIDNKGKEHIVYNLCPHMKCSLVFNEVEKTWDCPCHGSRYDIDGKCIFGPSNKDIGFKE